MTTLPTRFPQPMQTSTLLETTWRCVVERGLKILGLLCVTTLPILVLVLVFGTVIMFGVMGAISTSHQFRPESFVAVAIAGTLVFAVVGAMTYVLTLGGTYRIVADWTTGSSSSITEVLRWAWSRSGKMALAALFYGLLVFFGLCFCFIPGIVIGFLGLWSTTIAAAEDRTAIDSMQRSYALMQRNWLEVFLAFCVVAVASISTSVVQGLGNFLGQRLFQESTVAGVVLLCGVFLFAFVVGTLVHVFASVLVPMSYLAAVADEQRTAEALALPPLQSPPL